MRKSNPQLHQHDEHPPADFIRLSPGLTAASAQLAWTEFKRWSMRNAKSRFAQFWQQYNARKAAIKSELDAWENPFINARQGEPYRIEFEVPALISKFKFYDKDLAACGLELLSSEGNKCVICGMPQASGSFTIRMACAWPGKIRSMPPLARSFQFFVNPDPRQLWEDIPSDQAAEYGRPDLAYASLVCANASMWAASRRGRSHAHTGKPRDDAFEIGCEAGWHILAVADGAGSAPYSRKGAELACANALFACRQKLEHASELDRIFSEISAGQDVATWQPPARKLAWNVLPYAAFEARKAILAEAEATGREARAYATTLLLAMAKKYPDGWAVMSFQIGDGAMAMISPQGISLLAEPDEGEFGGQTRFLTMAEIFEATELARRLRIDFTPNLDGLMLLTDGVSDPYFAGAAALRDETIWQRLWQEALTLCQSGAPEAGFYELLDFWAHGSHDDRTIAIMRTL